MGFVWAFAATTSAIIAMLSAYLTVRVWRSNPAAYETNQQLTGGFIRAALGRVASLVTSDATDFRVNHFAEPSLDESGEDIVWERAASLSDEAVDGVLARHR